MFADIALTAIDQGALVSDLCRLLSLCFASLGSEGYDAPQIDLTEECRIVAPAATAAVTPALRTARRRAEVAASPMTPADTPQTS